MRQLGACQYRPYFGRGKIWGGVEHSAFRNSLIDVSAEPRVPETHLFGTLTPEQRFPTTAGRIGRSSGTSIPVIASAAS